jgi:hypothetical protein
MLLQVADTLLQMRNFQRCLDKDLRVAEDPLFNVVLAIAKVQELADGQQVWHTQEHLIITIDLEGEKKYLDQKKLYYCPIQRRIGLYVPKRKLILWSTGLCSVKLELIKIGQIRRFFNILTGALKKSLEAKTFRLWRLEQLLFQHGRLHVLFYTNIGIVKKFMSKIVKQNRYIAKIIIAIQSIQ